MSETFRRPGTEITLLAGRRRGPVELMEEPRMNFVRLALATALVISSGAAVAQTATDAGCLMLSSAFAQKSADEQVKKIAETAYYFYLGRVLDRTTAPQMKALLDQQSKVINDATATAMMKNCVQTLQSRSDLVQSLSAPPSPSATKPK